MTLKIFILNCFFHLYLCFFIYSQNVENIDMISLQRPSEIAQKNDKEDNNEIFKIGDMIYTDITTSNSGTYDNNCWLLKISAKDAVALSIHFDYFNLQNDSEFMVFNKNGELFDIFKKENNLSGGGFSIGNINGDEITIKYTIPKNRNFSADDFKISGIAYIYKEIEDSYMKQKVCFASAENCSVNINCSEGNNYQKQKRGVARIYCVNGDFVGYCSGTLINNTAQDGTPYFLTAAHCASNTDENDFAKWRFDFNYESDICDNPSSEPAKKTFVGCEALAKSAIDGGSDFLLLKLKNISQNDIKNHNLVLNGWSISAANPVFGACIQHPQGDIKKISFFNSNVMSATIQTNNAVGMENAHIKLQWIETQNGYGVTDKGSSGSPLFNEEGIVVATLSGGASTCLNLSGYDYFGKFSYHWDKTGSDSTTQLKYYLDPLKSNAQSCNTLDYEDNPSQEDSNLVEIFPNPNKGTFVIKFNNNLQHNVYIYNAQGNLINSYKNLANSEVIRINKCIPGIYIAIIINQNSIKQQKILFL